MWDLHPCQQLLAVAPHDSFVACFTWILSQASSEELMQVCASIWACWYHRNLAVFEGRIVDITQLSISFTKLVQEYQLYTQKISRGSPQTIQSQQAWKPPREGWVKINFDAHVPPTQERSLGVVIRDHNGQLLLTGTRRFQACWEVEATEAAAALYGLELAHRMGYECIQLEGDAITVIRKMLKHEDGLAPMYLIYENINVFSNVFTGFMCSHVKRGGNTVAHLVARWDTGPHDEKVCMYPFPQSVQTLADLDLM